MSTTLHKPGRGVVSQVNLTCRRKVKHPHVLSAMRAYVELATRPDAEPVGLNLYRCPSCRYWHLGRPNAANHFWLMGRALSQKPIIDKLLRRLFAQPSVPLSRQQEARVSQ